VVSAVTNVTYDFQLGAGVSPDASGRSLLGWRGDYNAVVDDWVGLIGLYGCRAHNPIHGSVS